MASLGHIAVGMAGARLYRRKQPVRFSTLTAMALFSALAMLPDADVLGFRFGVAYGDAWGHRGATHSLVFAAVVGTSVAAAAAARFGALFLRTAWFAIAMLASHGLLDTLTDGGRGCALFWPFTDARYFAPFRPIPVAPIGLRFFTAFGARVALIELLLFAPFWMFALWPGPERSGAAAK